jgi:hypothetical protein
MPKRDANRLRYRQPNFHMSAYASRSVPRMSSTGHCGVTPFAHWATVSDRNASSLTRSASFSRTVARRRVAISRTSAHEARPDPSKSNRARISTRLKPKSRARRIKS